MENNGTLWDKIFYYPDAVEGYLKVKPLNITQEDEEELKQYSALISSTNPDGFITYTFHTHENRHFGHNLFIIFHKAGYKDLKDKGDITLK